MKDQKGQALVEFILILPVLLLLFVGLFDIGNVFYQKYQLMNDLEVVTDLYQNEKIDEYLNYVNRKHLVLDVQKKNQFTTVILSKSISIKTPGLNQILKDKVELEATIYEK